MSVMLFVEVVFCLHVSTFLQSTPARSRVSFNHHWRIMDATSNHRNESNFGGSNDSGNSSEATGSKASSSAFPTESGNIGLAI